MDNRSIVEHLIEKRNSAALINVVRKAMNTSEYDGDDDDDYFNSDDNYSASEDRIPNLRMNYENNSSRDNSTDVSVSTNGYGYGSDSENELDSSDNKSYVDNFSDSDDERDRHKDKMPDLCLNLKDDSSVDNSDDEIVSTGEYNYESASNDELDSSDNKSDGNDRGWARHARAHDLEVARVREDREQRQRLATIQDIYVYKNHGRERRTTHQTTELI